MPAQSIEVWKLDESSAPCVHVQSVIGLLSPSFLCRHPTLPVLYAVERSWSGDDSTSGALTTFGISPDSGSLTVRSRCRSGGAFCAHVSVTPNGRFVMTANPRGPTVALFALDEAGVPAQLPACVVWHEGRGATERQGAPWPHSCYADNACKQMFVCDLGLDRVSIYDLNEATGMLSPAEQAFAQVSSGAGARHLAMDEQNRFLYVANELDSTVSVFSRDTATGRVRVRQTVSTVPPDGQVENQPAEIVLGPDGRFLYVTNRGHDSIAIFAVDLQTGVLRWIQCSPALGKSPRHFAIGADGFSAAVSNNLSQEVVIFHIERDGALVPTGQVISVKSPTCVALFGD